jgi:two-component system sensor histidine kinase KdpD
LETGNSDSRKFIYYDGGRPSWWRNHAPKHVVQFFRELSFKLMRWVSRFNPATRSGAGFGGSEQKLFGRGCGYVFALLLVGIATSLAVPLELVLSNANLALVYVLAVIVTGLKAGPGPAVAGSFLAFLSFNFFLTEPRYTFHVMRPHEVATLIFMLLIALVCGPVASRIRRQILLLRQANRYSEAMRLLGQELSVAEDVAAVWLALVRVIKSTLNVDRVQNVDCVIVATDDNESHQAVPPTTSAFAPLDTAAIDWTRKHGRSSGRFSDTLSAANWTVFPINKQNRCIACALIKTEPDMRALNAEDTALITAILQQGADTWRRIQLVSELEFARIKTEMEQLRSALLSSVSHDLKSPLSAMMGAAESLQLLDRQLTPSDRAELADTILQESRRLDTYIQNLLDMTRLGHGGLKIERDWVSLADIVGSALTRLKRYFPGVKLECQLPTPAPVIYVHAALVEQAIFNILENAAKFSPPEETIRILVQATENRCVIEIEDRGPGIPEAMREKVFDMFYVVADGDQKKQNTGMGLAICRGMIGAHGGSVKAVAGSGNKGTCFIVELPINYPSVDQVH